MTKNDDTKKSLEEILHSSNKLVLEILHNSTNTKEILTSFFPDEPE